MDKCKSEILRYLGHKGQKVPQDIDDMIEECIVMVDEAAAPRHVMQGTYMAATLGADVDRLIMKWEHIDLTRALVLDACATQLIEEYCDTVAPQRVSPGYGDLPLDMQPQILDMLNAGRRIGLTCTESLILIPRKSITAIVGASGHGCKNCKMNCSFRKDSGAHECERMATERLLDV